MSKEEGWAYRIKYGKRPQKSLARFWQSMRQWAKAGFPIAPAALYARRRIVCGGCEFWQGRKFFGLGKCLKCKCSGIKLHLATEKCPVGKW